MTICVDVTLFRCTGGYYVQALLITFFLFSSDIFIILRYAQSHLFSWTIRFYLRIRAITAKNKILVGYFSILALVRLILSIVVAFVNPLVVPIHPPPIDQFARCGLVEDFRFQLVPNYIGTVFGMCLYATHVGFCSWKRFV